MIKKNILIYSCLFVLLGSCDMKQEQVELFSSLDRQIDSMRIAYNFPAVAYGVIRNDSILALNALGYRDIQTKERVEATDFFNIGSCTKSFTAFLAGK
jgi:CubicO group peptidase (beta-lactamase class C family)